MKSTENICFQKNIRFDFITFFQFELLTFISQKMCLTKHEFLKHTKIIYFCTKLKPVRKMTNTKINVKPIILGWKMSIHVSYIKVFTLSRLIMIMTGAYQMRWCIYSAQLTIFKYQTSFFLKFFRTLFQNYSFAVFVAKLAL